MRRWFRVTLPVGWAVGGFILLYLILEGICLYFVGAMAGHRPADFLIDSAVVVYGGARVLGFHPVFNVEYHKWLAASPWTNRKPLPAGPVHLVAQDVVVLGILAAVAYLRHPAMNLSLLVTKFLMAYEVALCLSFVMLSRPWFAYAIAFGFGLFVLAWPWPGAPLAVAAGLYVVSLAGLVRSLNDFENWDLSKFEDSPFLTMSQQKALDRMRQNVLGWPFDCIRPTDVAPSVSYVHGCMLSLLAGWWVFVILQQVPALPRPEAWDFLLGAFLTMPTIVSRLQIYCMGYAPPISLWGRIVTLRWIVPGYDQVLLAPLAIAGAAVAGHCLIVLFPEQVAFIVPGTAVAILMCAFNLGPSLARWRLTGHHRLSPTFLMAKKQSEVQQV
jgi:hypothetical protein